MRVRFRVVISCRGILNSLIIRDHAFVSYEGVVDASVNTCCKLKLVVLEKRL